MLPIPYFHQVFTLPHCLNPLFLRDSSAAHALLFEAAAKTVVDVCRTNLGATPGLITLLHTWNQQLEHHPHIHCIATGGGLSQDSQRWISSRPNFFLPVFRLSEVFRGKLLEAFELALAEGRLPHTSEATGRLLLRRAAMHDFVVYSKPPMAGPEQVLRYLARYTHRIAIGNERIVAHEKGEVTFSFKDRKDAGRRKSTTLPGAEFTRRFLLHVVPRRFVRVRHYGLLANGVKAQRLARARSLLETPPPPSRPRPNASPGRTAIVVSWERIPCSAPSAPSAISSSSPTFHPRRCRRERPHPRGHRDPLDARPVPPSRPQLLRAPGVPSVASVPPARVRPPFSHHPFPPPRPGALSTCPLRASTPAKSLPP